MKVLEIDFEFNKPANKDMNLVCCSIRPIHNGKPQPIEEYWTYGKQYDELKCRLAELTDHIFIAHNVVAEARSVLSLGLDPRQFDWFCTFAMWRMITNHNSDFRYGKHLVKTQREGYVVKTLIPPKWSTVSDKESHRKLTHGLVEMVYRLLEVRIDGDVKDRMRDIIIADEEVEDYKEEIMKYCSSDIIYLYKCANKMYKYLEKNLELCLHLGSCMVRTAMIEHEGYPIDGAAVRNFARAVPRMLRDCQRDINRQFPDMKVFKFDKRTLTYAKKEQPIRDWINTLDFADTWDRTPSGRHSLSIDAFTKHFNYKHSFPRGNFGAQMLRFLKLRQHLNGFLPKKTNQKAKTFFDYVGEDGRVRCNLNPFGSQSSRFQPSSTGFMFLKSAWMRSLVRAPKGKYIAGIDYSSEEYLIAAVESGDKKMKEAYASGDVYLAYAKEARLVPEDATKKSHAKERDLAKPVVLGISYDMTEIGLSRQLSEVSGEYVSESEAKEFIDIFYDKYYGYTQYKEKVQQRYKEDGYLELPSGWVMWGDNPNHRSVGNFPIQGLGADILRKAIEYCQERGLKVIIPLHDALYIELDELCEDTLATFAHCMIDAFEFFFPDSGIRIDGEVWGHGLTKGEIITTPHCDFKKEEIHVDERGVEEYKTFSKYFKSTGSKYL